MKRFLTVMSVAALALPSAAVAQPTTGPEEGPGCFGQWRAGSVQAINSATPAGNDNAGAVHFSARKGDNATINAENRATCAAL